MNSKFVVYHNEMYKIIYDYKNGYYEIQKANSNHHWDIKLVSQDEITELDNAGLG